MNQNGEPGPQGPPHDPNSVQGQGQGVGPLSNVHYNRGQQQQQAQQQQMQYVPVDAQVPGGPVPPGTNPQLQQTTYYLQQPMYLDQNGQPMYYRVGPGGAPYQQEMMYAQNPDGTPNEAMMAYVTPYGQMNGQQMPRKFIFIHVIYINVISLMIHIIILYYQ